MSLIVGILMCEHSSFIPLNSLSQVLLYAHRISSSVSFTLPPTRGQAHSVKYLGCHGLLVYIRAGREKYMYFKKKGKKRKKKKERQMY